MALALNVELLSWDSDFFGFPVAKISSSFESLDGTILFDRLATKNIHLAYYYSAVQLYIPDNNIYKIKMVDEKVTYIKDISSSFLNTNISRYEKNYPEEKLISLAIESGIYSRFNVDKKIGQKNFENLYTHWIVNSVSKKIADEVLVYKDGNDIVGFVTIGEKNNRADIGIIAVDKSHRGQGIGKVLMLSAENRYVGKLNAIQVVTQGDNKPACGLYENCGYRVEKKEYIYHLWKK